MDSQLAKNLVSEPVAIHPEMPWKDINGEDLSDENLRTASQNWSQSAWEAYLRNSETPLSESLLTQLLDFEITDSSQSEFFERSEQCAPNALKSGVKLYLDQLTPRQRQILRLTFWDNKSEREIAADLKISRSTVKEIKKRVLRSKLTAQRLRAISRSFGYCAAQPDAIPHQLT